MYRFVVNLYSNLFVNLIFSGQIYAVAGVVVIWMRF